MSDLERRLREVAEADVEGLLEAENSYGSSWRRRGGVGAFMMLARKWDRLENALRPESKITSESSWDIFRACEIDRREEGIIDDIRDLRRYLMLVEEFVTRPADTETSSMDAYLLHRYPVNATSAEYASFADNTIQGGVCSGKKVSVIYEESSEMHPWRMKQEYRSQYGRS